MACSQFGSILTRRSIEQPDTLARRLSGKNTKAKINRVRDMLDVMEALGQAELDDEGRYFVSG